MCYFPLLNGQNNEYIIANPLNLNYRFQFEDPSFREAADPVLEYFNGKYYLFASKSGGYWSSENLAEWTYIPCKSISTIENYAPTILILDDAMYYLGSGGDPKIYKSTNPDEDNWELIETKFRFPLVGNVDPAFFRDDDGRVYIYWGCSDKDPIIGVEVNPNDGFNAIGEAAVLIEHHPDKYGWEVSGENNETGKAGWNEGPCVIKNNGKYYLHYAAPGTQFRVYGDGLYVSDKPLGPYVYEENSPFSFKPGGFIGGAGHGHTFKDKYGNYWHVATMKISVRHMFERRICLLPAFMSKDNTFHAHAVLTDFPFYIPQEKTDFEKTDFSMGWNLLSYNKKATSSSELTGYETEKANDEQVETWWSAETGNPGEWWQVDLGKIMRVNAIQINFADQDFTLKAANSYFNYQYEIVCSEDGKTWNRIVNRINNEKDMPHDLVVLDQSVRTRFLKIVNTKDVPGKFSLSGFRVFGNGEGIAPLPVSDFNMKRDENDSRIYRFNWKSQDNATGYIIRWGIQPGYLKNAVMVFGNEYEGRFFNRNSEYYFTIDAFNENGITSNDSIYSLKSN